MTELNFNYGCNHLAFVKINISISISLSVNAKKTNNYHTIIISSVQYPKWFHYDIKEWKKHFQTIIFLWVSYHIWKCCTVHLDHLVFFFSYEIIPLVVSYITFHSCPIYGSPKLNVRCSICKNVETSQRSQLKSKWDISNVLWCKMVPDMRNHRNFDGTFTKLMTNICGTWHTLLLVRGDYICTPCSER